MNASASRISGPRKIKRSVSKWGALVKLMRPSDDDTQPSHHSFRRPEETLSGSMTPAKTLPQRDGARVLWINVAHERLKLERLQTPMRAQPSAASNAIPWPSNSGMIR